MLVEKYCLGSIRDKNCLLLQTYGLQLKDSSAVEMCTFVRKVQQDSAAENAGLTAGEAPTSSVQTLHMISYSCEIIRPHIPFLTDRSLSHVTYHPHAHTDAQTQCKAMLISRNWWVPFFCILIAGDIIVTINGVSIEGSSHQQILNLIRESTNSLKWVTSWTMMVHLHQNALKAVFF